MEEGPVVAISGDQEDDETENDGKAGTDKPTYFLEDE